MALGKTVGQLERELTAKEWAEWRTFMAHELIGADRDDLRSALLTNTVRQIAGNPSDLSACLPQWQWPDLKDNQEMSEQDMIDALQQEYGA